MLYVASIQNGRKGGYRNVSIVDAADFAAARSVVGPDPILCGPFDRAIQSDIFANNPDITIGRRVQLNGDEERGMEGSCPAGARGTITDIAYDTIGVTMDDHFPWLDEWNNVLTFPVDEGEGIRDGWSIDDFRKSISFID